MGGGGCYDRFGILLVLYVDFLDTRGVCDLVDGMKLLSFSLKKSPFFLGESGGVY